MEGSNLGGEDYVSFDEDFSLSDYEDKQLFQYNLPQQQPVVSVQQSLDSRELIHGEEVQDSEKASNFHPIKGKLLNFDTSYNI